MTAAASLARISWLKIEPWSRFSGDRICMTDSITRATMEVIFLCHSYDEGTDK